MLPVVKTVNDLDDVTVVADASMVPHDNRNAIDDASLSYIIGQRLSDVPYGVEQWLRARPGTAPEEGGVLPRPPPDQREHAASSAGNYRCRQARARGALRGIDWQVAKTELAAAGRAPAKLNRFLTVTGEDRGVNREWEAKAWALAGFKGHSINLLPDRASPDFVTSADHRLWQIEKSFRMSKHDLATRPRYIAADPVPADLARGPNITHGGPH